jgi:hypothetical protein
MKLTWTVTRDGNAWKGDSVKTGGTKAQARDTPKCTSGTHTYQLTATLNYYYLNQGPITLGPQRSVNIKCTG